MAKKIIKAHDYKVNGHFIPHRFDMLKSDKWQKLGPTAKLILLRLELEYARCGGRDNDCNMIVTVRQMMEWCGVSDRAVKTAVTELKKARFIRHRAGMSGAKGYGRSAQFGLTYLPTVRNDGMIEVETDGWDTTGVVVSIKSGRKEQTKNRSLVSSHNDTSPVSSHNDTMHLISTRNCEQEVPVNPQVNVVPQRHDLESSYPVPPRRVQPERLRLEKLPWSRPRVVELDRRLFFCEEVA
jgi:hypothetical protein